MLLMTCTKICQNKCKLWGDIASKFDMFLVKFNDSKVIIINMSANVDSRWC